MVKKHVQKCNKKHDHFGNMITAKGMGRISCNCSKLLALTPGRRFGLKRTNSQIIRSELLGLCR